MTKTLSNQRCPKQKNNGGGYNTRLQAVMQRYR